MSRSRKGGLHPQRRPYGSLVIETYIYFHNQQSGIVVRRKYFLKNGTIIDRSKYFSEWRYGSLSAAEWHARRWKNQHLT